MQSFIWGDKSFLEVDSGDGCTTIGIYLMTPKVHFNLAKMVNFALYIFYHPKKGSNLKL